MNDRFDALSNYLYPEDPDEAARRYVRLHEKLAGYFRLKGTSDPENDADDALDRAGQKILNGYDIPDIDKFCIGIARNIVHERLRDEKRKENAAKEFNKNADDKNTDALDENMNLMRRCFAQLPAEDQDLLIEYCKAPPGLERAEHRRRLAKRLNSTIAALRIRVARLRRRLEKCVRDMRKRL